MKYLKLKETKGITLVALVVTIAVMLILGSIIVNTAVGDNGFISLTKKVKANEEIAQKEGQNRINELKGENVITGSDGVQSKTDTTGPTINGNIETGIVTTTSIQVKVNITETGSGIKSIEYSCDGTNYAKDLANDISTTYTFTGLTTATQYNIFVRLTDNSNNQTIVSTQITTK